LSAGDEPGDGHPDPCDDHSHRQEDEAHRGGGRPQLPGFQTIVGCLETLGTIDLGTLMRRDGNADPVCDTIRGLIDTFEKMGSMQLRQPHTSWDTLHRLIAAADLPTPRSVRPIDDGTGLDNRITVAELADGRFVVLRQSREPAASPRLRVQFLRANGIETPELYKSTDNGEALWEYVPGQTLARAVEEGLADETVWRRVGAALAKVHSVTFPLQLEGPIGADSLNLRPLDPVRNLQESLAASGAWVDRERPQLSDALKRVSCFISDRSSEIRASRSSVLHGDINLLNIIVNDNAVRLIDWDFPRVGQHLAELSALDEHAYLHGLDGLPAEFYEGYGRSVPENLLLAYRIVGCVGWLASDDWIEWDHNDDLPEAARSRLNEWHHRLLDWSDRIPDLAARLTPDLT
jgi:tRNA A-37 threonylcarbamoyl transferase component Bud32